MSKFRKPLNFHDTNKRTPKFTCYKQTLTPILIPTLIYWSCMWLAFFLVCARDTKKSGSLAWLHSHTYIKCKPHWSYLITTKRALTCKQPLSCLCFLKIDWWSWNTASIPLGFSSSSSSALFHLLHWPLDTSQQLPKLVTFTAFIIFLF